MQFLKSGPSGKHNDGHEIAWRPKADSESSSPDCGQHCVLRQLYNSSPTVSLPPEKVQPSLEADDLFYLQPGFDLCSMTLPQFRAILATHNVSFPSPSAAKKSQLVELVQRNVLPKAKTLLSTRDALRRAIKGNNDTRSSHLTPLRLSVWAKSRQVYRPLRPWQTRLIELVPSQDETSIPACRLFTVEFIDMEGVGITDTNEVVTYDAISYVWGQTTMDSHIICNGVEMPVSTNLAVALRHLAKSEHRKYYWCDGICIDQGNDLERAQQIRVMLRIFEKAEAVVAWMGELDVHHLPYLAFVKRDMDQDDSAFELAKGRIHHLECVLAVQNLQLVLHQLTCRPWFRRTWIRQEMFAAKNIVLHFENFRMVFDLQHKRLWQWLQCDPVMLKEPSRAMEKPLSANVSGQFEIMAANFRHHGTDEKDYAPPSRKITYSRHWLHTLQEGTAFEVTDPRDRVYALLGIIASPSTRFYVAPTKYAAGPTNGTAPQDFPIDYQKSVSEVYQDVMKYLINVERNLDCLCVFQDRRKQVPDMPSWLLDWRDAGIRTFVKSSLDSRRSEDILGKPPLQDLDNLSVLHISGFEACKIRSLHGVSSLSESPPQSLLWCTFGQEAKEWKVDSVSGFHEYYVEINRDVLRKPFSESIQFWVPRTSMLDDELVFAKGATNPLVLRGVRERTYQFIGPAVMVSKYDYKCNGRSYAGNTDFWSIPGSYTVCPNWEGQAELMKDYTLV